LSICHKSSEADAVLKALTTVRRHLCVEKNPPLDLVIEGGALPILARLLDNEAMDREIQYEVLWCLTNIASGSTKHTECVVQLGVLPKVLHLMARSPSVKIQEQCVWLIGNIAGDSVPMRDGCLSIGTIPALLSFINSKIPLSLLRVCTWLMSNLLRNKPQPPIAKVLPLLPLLFNCLALNDQEVNIDALWALAYFVDGENERIERLASASVLKLVVNFLAHPSPVVVTPALRLMGNVVTGNNEQTELALSCGLAPALLPLLSSPKKAIRREAAWSVSNITAGPSAHIQQAIDAGLLKKLIEVAQKDEADISRECLFGVSNALSESTYPQFQAIKSAGLYPMFPALCQRIMPQDSVKVWLSALEHALKLVSRNENWESERNEMGQCGVVEALKSLSKHAAMSEAAIRTTAQSCYDLLCHSNSNPSPNPKPNKQQSHSQPQSQKSGFGGGGGDSMEDDDFSMGKLSLAGN